MGRNRLSDAEIRAGHSVAVHYSRASARRGHNEGVAERPRSRLGRQRPRPTLDRQVARQMSAHRTYRAGTRTPGIWSAPLRVMRIQCRVDKWLADSVWITTRPVAFDVECTINRYREGRLVAR